MMPTSTGEILRSSEFFGGAYADAVLVVHSNAPDEALAELDRVEDPDSPVRIIISVGMLKEGWDVRNVYVVASMRSSVSEILTEQTLGRECAFPLARTRASRFSTRSKWSLTNGTRTSSSVRAFSIRRSSTIELGPRCASTPKDSRSSCPETVGGRHSSSHFRLEAMVLRSSPTMHRLLWSRPWSSGRHRQHQAVVKMKREIARRPDAPAIAIPLLRMTAVESSFSVADITDVDAFRKLGAALAANPDGELNRTLVSARVVVGPDGIKHTELVRSEAADRIRSTPSSSPSASCATS